MATLVTMKESNIGRCRGNSFCSLESYFSSFGFSKGGRLALIGARGSRSEPSDKG